MSQKIGMTIIKYFALKRNNMAYQNLWDAPQQSIYRDIYSFKCIYWNRKKNEIFQGATSWIVIKYPVLHVGWQFSVQES